jgi:diketogulonate reductase-like aldo/keto reductase
MTDLQKEGKVRWIGVSNFEVAHMERVVKIAPITSNQPPYLSSANVPTLS